MLNYGTLLNRQISLTTNTPAAVLLNYLSHPGGNDGIEYMQNNSNNTNLKAIDVMKAINAKYSHGKSVSLYNVSPFNIKQPLW
jgi:hypothetical protein